MHHLVFPLHRFASQSWGVGLVHWRRWVLRRNFWDYLFFGGFSYSRRLRIVLLYVFEAPWSIDTHRKPSESRLFSSFMLLLLHNLSQPVHFLSEFQSLFSLLYQILLYLFISGLKLWLPLRNKLFSLRLFLFDEFFSLKNLGRALMVQNWRLDVDCRERDELEVLSRLPDWAFVKGPLCGFCPFWFLE